jgi:Zn-dependent protease
VSYAVYRVTHLGIWGAIGHFGAWVNLFNLLPVWQLDGGRGFRTLTRSQRWLAAAVAASMWFVTREALLILIALAGAASAGFATAAEEPDQIALLEYALLIAALSALARIARGT